MNRIPEQAKQEVLKEALCVYTEQLDKEYMETLKAILSCNDDNDKDLLMIKLQGIIETKSITIALLMCYNV